MHGTSPITVQPSMEACVTYGWSYLCTWHKLNHGIQTITSQATWKQPNPQTQNALPWLGMAPSTPFPRTSSSMIACSLRWKSSASSCCRICSSSSSCSRSAANRSCSARALASSMAYNGRLGLAGFRTYGTYLLNGCVLVIHGGGSRLWIHHIFLPSFLKTILLCPLAYAALPAQTCFFGPQRFFSLVHDCLS